MPTWQSFPPVQVVSCLTEAWFGEAFEIANSMSYLVILTETRSLAQLLRSPLRVGANPSADREVLVMVVQTSSSRRVSLILCAAAMGLVLALAADGEGASYTYTKIAETSSAANGFSNLNIPSLGDNGTVAFSARLNSALIGIFTGDGTSVKPIVDTSGSFTTLGTPSINSVGTVAFWARLNDGSYGIFTSDGTTVTTIVGPSANSLGTNPAINDGKAVAFEANGGIFTGSGGSTTPVADTSGPFSSLSFPSITITGTVAFRGTLDAGGTGIFTGSSGSTTTIIDDSGTFSGLSFPAINDGGMVVFWASRDAGGSGIFTSNGTAVSTIADTDGPFTFFSTPSINDVGAIAFQGFLLSGAGIFTGPDPAGNKVIAVGDLLDGSSVAGLAFSREGLNDAAQVAFFASLADGRQGIFRADPEAAGDPVPPPDPAPEPDPVPPPDPVPSTLHVPIDITPGGNPNSINLGSKGTLVVAILSTASFDATTVNPTTVALAGAYVKSKQNGTRMVSYEDVNGDGLLDLVVHVEKTALELNESSTEAVLTGETTNGTMITGSQSVRVVR